VPNEFPSRNHKKTKQMMGQSSEPGEKMSRFLKKRLDFSQAMKLSGTKKEFLMHQFYGNLRKYL